MYIHRRRRDWDALSPRKETSQTENRQRHQEQRRATPAETRKSGYLRRTEEFIRRASHQDDQTVTCPVIRSTSVMQSSNGSCHRSIKMITRSDQKRRSPIVETTVRPNGDSEENEPAYKGDTVRISPQPFDREYDERCTTVEYFVVANRGASKMFYDDGEMGWPSKFNSWIPTSVVGAAVDIHDASLTAAAGNILLVEG